MARRFEETVSLQAQNLSTGGAEAALTLADRLEGFKQQGFQRAEAAAVQRGVESASQTPLETTTVDGQRLTKAPEKQSGFIGSIQIDAHNKALRSAYLASLNNDNREAIANLELEHGSDLVGFNEAVAGYQKGVIASVDPGVRQLVGQDIDSKITSSRIRVQQSAIKQQKIEANAERNANIESASSAAFVAARNGDTLESAEALQDAFATIDSMVESGDMRTDIAQAQKREIEREASEQGIRKGFDDLVDQEGFDAAFDQLEERSKRVPKGWTPDEWDTFIADQQADLNRKFARDQFKTKENLKVVKQQASVDRGRLFTNPNIPADPAKGGQDRKDVNAAYEEDSQAWQGLPVQDQVNNNVEFIKNTGIVPDQMISNINAAMRSGNAEQVALMSDLVGRLEELPNAANALRDLPDESRALSRQIADSVRSGIEPEIATEIARKNTFGMTQQQKEAIKINSQAVAKELPDFLENQVDAKFDPSSIPFFGEEPDIPTDMQADYNVAFNSFMTLTNGNSEQAKELAFGSVQKIWAITDVGGDNRFMKFAPEAFYSVDGFDNAWIDRQFLSDMEDKGVIGAQLSTDFNTGRSQTPSYPIVVTNEQGILDIARDEATGLPLKWKPDFRQTDEFQDLQAAPGKAIASAKKKRGQNLERRANYLRRKVHQITFVGIPRSQREKFIGTEEGITRTRRAINNLLATEKVDRAEAKQLVDAFGAGDFETLPAARIGEP